MIINESNMVSNDTIIKYVKNQDHKALTQYLKSMPDDTIVYDPSDKKTTYHKASNGVKSGWSENVNGNRVNVYLWKDDEVASCLIRNSVVARR